MNFDILITFDGGRLFGFERSGGVFSFLYDSISVNFATGNFVSFLTVHGANRRIANVTARQELQS